MNRINSFNLLAEKYENPYNYNNLRVETNNLLMNTPRNQTGLAINKANKSPIMLKSIKTNQLDININLINKQTTPNNIQNKKKLFNGKQLDKTEFPSIPNKPLLTDSNFTNKFLHEKNSNTNNQLKSKFNNIKSINDKKGNLKYILTNNNFKRDSDLNINETQTKKENFGSSIQFEFKNKFFQSIETSSKYSNNQILNNSESPKIRKKNSLQINNPIQAYTNNRLYSEDNMQKNIFLKDNKINNFPDSENNDGNNINNYIKGNNNINSEDNNNEEKKANFYSVKETTGSSYQDNNNSYIPEPRNPLNSNFNNTQNSSLSRKRTPPKNVVLDTNNYGNLNNKGGSDIPISSSNLNTFFTGYEKAKGPKKQISQLIKSYAANTYQGIVR